VRGFPSHGGPHNHPQLTISHVFQGEANRLGSSMLGPSLNGQNRLLGQIHLSMVKPLCFLTSHHGMAVDATSKLQVGLVDHRFGANPR
jgi:hypothetical protein